MARALSAHHMRMVIEGSDTAPSTLMSEYVVKVDTDLYETPATVDEASPTFTNTVASLWQTAVSNAKTAEGLT